MRSLFDPCGSWQVAQLSPLMPACSNRNGPRFSAWHDAHASLTLLPVREQLDVGRSVRVVARRAFHLAFANRHVAGAIELGDLVAMAVHAQLLLVRRLQLRGRRHRVMDAVARGAGDIARFVLAAFPQRVDALVVAGGARLADGLRRNLVELDRLDLLRIARMRFAGPMAGLTAHRRRRRARILRLAMA